MTNRLFDPVVFGGQDVLWNYRNRTERDFQGYYHWHQCMEVIFVHEGRGTVVLDRQAHEIRRGMLFVFQPFQLHHVYADVSPEQPYSRTIVYVDPVRVGELLRTFPKKNALFQALWQGRGRNHAYDMLKQAAAMEWSFSAFDRQRRQPDGGTAEDTAALLVQLLTAVADVYTDEREPLLQPGVLRSSRHSETVMRWVEAHYEEPISLERLAEETHLSQSYISRIFRRETGSSLTDYVTARRMKMACRLLETTDLPVEEIGIRAGIPNASYFIQLFKRVVGTTPLQYRIRLERARRR